MCVSLHDIDTYLYAFNHKMAEFSIHLLKNKVRGDNYNNLLGETESNI